MRSTIKLQIWYFVVGLLVRSVIRIQFFPLSKPIHQNTNPKLTSLLIVSICVEPHHTVISLNTGPSCEMKLVR